MLPIPLKKCPKCDGRGYYQEIVVHYGVPGGGDGPIYDCGLCNGKGRIPFDLYFTYVNNYGAGWMSFNYSSQFGYFLLE